MKLRQILLIAFISPVCAVATVAIYTRFTTQQISSTQYAHLPLTYAKYEEGTEETNATAPDFTRAASLAVTAVVHIKTQTFTRRRTSGSGVIISNDGYIVTGNHVITDRRGNVAGEITVTLNNRKTYTAIVVGRDSGSDIAVLKISGEQLPHLVFGNSDDIQSGQWVLAVGYPLSLEATVTAGIISATGRSIGITTRQINNTETSRSFIQTDAALNTGNSGGALVSTDGKLIGINSGIISPTGTYAGYSFAIPVNTVKKAVKDIIQSSGVKPRGG